MSLNQNRRILKCETLEDRTLLTVLVSEFQAGQSAGSDWVELFNSGSSSQAIANWELLNYTGDEFDIPASTTPLAAKEYRRFVTPGLLSKNDPFDVPPDRVVLRDDNEVQVGDMLNYPEQPNDASYGIVPGTELNAQPDYRFFETPTPNEQNGYVWGVTPTGMYTSSFQLDITMPTGFYSGQNNFVNYTVDGTLPTTTNGTPYDPNAKPTISTSTTVRYAVGVGGQIKESGSRTYLFEDDVVNSVDADNGPGVLTATADTELRAAINSLPALIVTVDGLASIPINQAGNGINVVSTVEFVEDGVDKFRYTAEIKSHGNSCDAFDNPKPCYRLSFNTVTPDPDDPSRSGIKKLPYDFYPTADFPGYQGFANDQTIDQLVLRAGNQDSFLRDTPATPATYIRDSFGRETYRELGGLAPHQRPVNLFVNHEYVGLYFVSERITGDFIESYLGGDDDDNFVVRTSQVPFTPYLEEGPQSPPESVGEWRSFFHTQVSPELEVDGASLTIKTGRETNLFANVDSNVDVDNLIDFVLANQITKHLEFQNGDNFYASKVDNAGAKWQFHTWDVENWITSTGNDSAVVLPLNATELQNGLLVDEVMHPLYLHSVLMETNTYQTKVQERLMGQNGVGGILRVGGVGDPNPMSLGGILHRVNDAVSEIAVAVKGDAIRYAGEGSPKTTVTSPSASVVSDLDSSTVPAVFASNLSLTGNATVEVQVQGSQWRIRDDSPVEKKAFDIWTTTSGDLDAYIVRRMGKWGC